MTVNKAIRNLLVILNFVIFLPGAAVAEEQDHQLEQVVNVLVTNSSQNDTGAENCPVQLTLFTNNKQVKQMSSLTDGQGMCTFEELPSGDVYAIAEAMHDNIAFSSKPVKLTHKHEPHEIRVRVYDISFDRDAIKSDTHHIILKSITNKILITEYIQIVNGTQKAISSNIKDMQSKPNVIEINLPKGFQQLKLLNYFNPKATVITDTGFYDTMAVAPGRYNAAYSYILPVDSESYNFSKKLTLAAKEVTIFAQLNGSKITGLGESAGEVVIQDGTEANYYTFEVPENNELSFQISGLMVSKPADKKPDITAASITTVVAIIIAAAGFLIFKRKKKKV